MHAQVVLQQDLADLAEQITAEHAACETAFGSAVDHAITAGRLLAKAKGKVGHGSWSSWLDENFPASIRTAQNYMRLADRAQDAQRVAHLGVAGALRELAVPSSTTKRRTAEEPIEGTVQDVERVVERLGDDAEDALWLWMHYHRRQPSESYHPYIKTVCGVFGVRPLIDELTGTQVPGYVWLGWITPQGDYDVHPGWVGYCARLGGVLGTLLAQHVPFSEENRTLVRLEGT